jgi:hypothetical protein
MIESNDLTDLPPDVLAAFYGKNRVESVQSFFSSRADLLNAYATSVASTYCPETAKLNRCELCDAQSSPAAWIVVTWSARIRWRIGNIILRVILYIVLYPLIGLLAHVGLGEAFDGIFSRLPVSDRTSLKTHHPVCATCLRRTNSRRIFHRIAANLLLLVGLFFAIAGVVIAALSIADFVTIAHPHMEDAFISAALFAICMLLASCVYFIGKKVVPRILMPRQIAGLVRPPFYRQAFELTGPA